MFQDKPFLAALKLCCPIPCCLLCLDAFLQGGEESALTHGCGVAGRLCCSVCSIVWTVRTPSPRAAKPSGHVPPVRAVRLPSQAAGRLSSKTEGDSGRPSVTTKQETLLPISPLYLQVTVRWVLAVVTHVPGGHFLNLWGSFPCFT